MSEEPDPTGEANDDPAENGSDKGPRLSFSLPPAWQWGGFAVFLVAFTWLYFFIGTHLIYETNQDRLNWDQQHNIKLAFKAKERAEAPTDTAEGVAASLWRSFPHYTEGVVNPLWPWIAARFADEDHERFFVRGKWFNLTASAIFLLMLGIIAARAFSIPSAITILLLGGLGSVLPRAPFFQPETIYYILLFLAWMVALSLLRRNTLWHYGLLGFLLGVAYLAKTSVQPFLLVFAGVTFLRTAVEWWRNRRLGEPADAKWSLPNQFIGIVVLAAAFLVAASPRLNYASERFGDPFHSFPSYWMWMDDFSEAADFMRQYNKRDALEAMTPKQKPSLSNYLKTHETSEFIDRLRDGTAKKLREVFFPGEKLKAGRTILLSRGWLLFWLIAMLGVIAVFHALAARKRDELVWPIGPQSARWMVLFAFGTFAVSALAYGFYEPIGKGDRFMLSLFLPVIVTILWIIERFRRQLQRTDYGPSVNRVFLAMNAVVFVAVGWRVIELLRDPVFVGK